MAENNQESQGLEASPQPEATPKEGDRQSLLLMLAERTVLQAESLAQEITDRAKQESEAEGAKLLAQYTEQAKAEAQKTIEDAQSRTEKALSKARSESEKTLSKARSESEKILSKARSESEESLSKAQTEGREFLANAQIQVNEILGKAQQEAQTIINASQARAESTESNARLKAEFIIRQTTQNVADGIRSAVLETCNHLLPALDKLGKDAAEAPFADQADHAVATETCLIENAVSNETEKSSSPAFPAGADTSAQSSDTPSGRRTKSSVRTQGRA